MTSLQARTQVFVMVGCSSHYWQQILRYSLSGKISLQAVIQRRQMQHFKSRDFYYRFLDLSLSRDAIAQEGIEGYFLNVVAPFHFHIRREEDGGGGLPG